MSNSVDPDETAQYEPSHLGLCRLQKPILSPVAVEELTTFQPLCAFGILSTTHVIIMFSCFCRRCCFFMHLFIYSEPSLER